MPIYDFQCSSCGFKDEVMRKISAASIEACPKCGAETFSKQLSAPSFQLSGSGWYATDFKNGSAKPAAASTMSNPDVAKKNDSAETKSADGASTEKSSQNSSEKKSEAAPAACKTGCACH